MNKTPSRKYTLYTENGAYYEDSIFVLVWEVFMHRLTHWLAGEGWRD